MNNDIGINTDGFENVIKTSEDNFASAKSNINSLSDVFDIIKPIFSSNNMGKIVQNLDSIKESHNNVKMVTDSYITSLKDVKKSYDEQSEAIANSLNQ